MSITVRYFASLKEYVGRNEDQHSIAMPTSAKVIWGQLNPTLSLPDNTLVAVNMNYANLDTEVSDGDELAFFPPVTGG